MIDEHMENATADARWLDRPLAAMVTWNWEKIAWGALLLVAIVLRFYDLGSRSMSHDESEHAWFAYNLFAGKGYEHSPVYHGPFAYHVLALFYLLFGDSTVMARVPTALFGIGAILLVWPMRRWLGRLGAFFAATLITFSPALLHYARHTRHDSYTIFFALLLMVAVFGYLEQGARRGEKLLYVAAAALSLMLATKEVAFIYGAALGGFLILLLVYRWFGDALEGKFSRGEAVEDEAEGDAAAEPWAEAYPATVHRVPMRAPRRDWLVLGAVVIVSLLGAVIFRLLGMGDASYDGTGAAGVFQILLPVLVIGLPPLAAVGLAVWRRFGGGSKATEKEEAPAQFSAPMDLAILLGTLILPWLAPFPATLFGYDVLNYTFPAGILPTLSLLLALAGMALAIGILWDARRWLIAAGTFYLLFFLFFTTFFSNGKGFATGIVGSLGYWLSQQEVARGSQPWYYYFIVTPLYEFLPIVLAVPVVLGAVFRRRRVQWLLIGLTLAAFAGWALTKLALSPLEPDSPLASVNKAFLIAAGFLFMLTVAWGALSRFRRPDHYFLAFLPLWVVAVWIAYSVAGEKMPWLVTHITLPMCIAGGWWLGTVVTRVDWRAVRTRGGIWIAVLLLPLVAALAALLSSRPFRDRTVDGLSETSQWLAALVIALVVAALLFWQARRLGWRDSLRVAGLTLVVLLGLWTVRTTYMLNFINPNNVSEYLFYAHASPDPAAVMEQLEDISRRTAGDKQLRIAHDDDSGWPFNWYLRDWPNATYFGDVPSREVLSDTPVVIVGSKNLDKVRPFLQRDYNEFNYRLIWWPDESYKNLSLEKIRQGITDPIKRKAFLDALLWREYSQPLAQWPLVHRFSLFVSKDLAAQLWDFGARPVTVEAVVDPYEQGLRELSSQRTLGFEGTGPGQLSFPRNVAVAPDGTTYVADSGNHRIQVFDWNGNYLFEWGTSCEVYADGLPGCIDPDGDGPLQLGDGQMREPWGIAVSQNGDVYVADTWNHRIQHFDGQGNFIGKWGRFETTGGEAVGSPGGFWGPRAIAVDAAGNLYVTDTGNKRVQVFTADGDFLGQMGGGGVVEGRLDEPVGIAIVPDPDGGPGGTLYVADTWNLRVQKFAVTFGAEGPMFTYLAEWPIEGWSSQSVVNKPYLAVDEAGERVYVTDPENRRVLVFDGDGEFVATFGFYGVDAQSFGLPNGIAVGSDGNVYVVDADNHRIMVFPPVQ